MTHASKKGRSAVTDRPLKPKHPTLQDGKNGSADYTPADAHVLALAHALAYLMRHKAKVLAVYHTAGHAPLVVIEFGPAAWMLPEQQRTGIIGRGNGRIERYEAMFDGVRIGWERDPSRRYCHFH